VSDALAGTPHWRDDYPSKTRDQMKPQALFFYRRKGTARERDHLAGTGPDEMLYGRNHLGAHGFATSFLEGGLGEGGWRRRLWKPAEGYISRRLRMGFLWHLAQVHQGELAAAGVVFTTTDACGLPVARLKALGRLRTPLVYLSQGLSDRLAAMPPGRLRESFRRAYSRYLRAAERVLVLGEGAAEPLLKELDLEPDRVHCLQFGVDRDFWTPGNEPDQDYVFSAGSDLGRDYDTLLGAAGDLPLKIVTRLPLAGARGPQVEVGSQFTVLELRELYRRAAVVAITLKDVAQPTGQSSALQAMACGKATIVTRFKGLWDPQGMRHGENCLLVEPGNAQELREAIDKLREDRALARRLGRAARESVERIYNSGHMAGQLAEHLSQAMGLAQYPGKA